jgi:uncharacterized membrane protein
MFLFGYDWPRLHAALNVLPAALLFASVLFDMTGLFTRRASLQATGLWTLWAGVVGGWLAVIAGLKAEHVIDHGEALHEVMEAHERAALITMSIFTVVLCYRLLRQAGISGRETLAVRCLSVAGFVGIVWTGRLGGEMMFDHAAGVSTTTLQAEILDRAKGHHHQPADQPEDHDTGSVVAPRP